MKKHWYLIQYDIRNVHRLRRVHRFIKQSAIALQESVFLWQGTASELKALQHELLQLIKPNQDDVRGYQLKKNVQLIGRSPFTPYCYWTDLPVNVHSIESALSETI